jgi:dCMP deaminase
MRERPSKEETFVAMVKEVAKRSTCLRPREIDGQVGAILVKEGRVISTGYAGSPRGMPHCLDEGCLMDGDACVRTIHAEANAIAFAAKSGTSTDGTTMYCTLAPCLSCAKLIINSGVKEVIFLNDYRITDGIELLIVAGVRVRKYELH